MHRRFDSRPSMSMSRMRAVAVGAVLICGLLRSASAWAITTADADSAFNSFNAAFLVTQNGVTYYKERLNSTADQYDYFWRQALAIQMAEDAYMRTKNPTHRALIDRLLNGFINKNTSDWTWNQYNDDLLWATLAFVRGYRVTGNTTYLNLAKNGFALAYNRGWDTTLGGGLWWDIAHTDKSGLSNNPAVLAACYLYEATRDSAYLTKAQAIYAWTRSTLYNASTGAVYENIRANGTVTTEANVYNVGAFIGAANCLHRLTGEDRYYDDALRSVEFVKNNKTVNGVISDNRKSGTWASEFARALGEFVRDNNLWSTYYPWMVQNANAAWANRRTDKNLSWNAWAQKTESAVDTEAIDYISAVVMLQVTPPTQPGFVSGSWYRLVPKINTSSVLEVFQADPNNGAKTVIWSWLDTGNQKFRIDSVGRGYYRLVPNHAQDKSLDVKGGGSANGTMIDIWGSNTTTAQYWKIVYDEAGYYKLKPKCAPTSCLNVEASNPNNGASCVLYQETFGDNELWMLQP